MLTSFLKSILNTTKHSEKRRRGRRPQRMEALESRVLLAAGGYDPSFDDNGIVTQDFEDSQDFASEVLVRPGGGSFVVGTTDNTDFGGDDFAVAAFNEDGSPDTSFSVDGRTSINFSFTDDGTSVDVAHAAALQSDGKLVVAGESDGSAALLRLNTDGTLDTSFGTDGTGKVVLSDSVGILSFDSIRDIAIDSNDQLVVVGGGHHLNSDGPADRALIARFEADGNLDISFSSDGIRALDAPAIGQAVAIEGESYVAAWDYLRPQGNAATSIRVARVAMDGASQGPTASAPPIAPSLAGSIAIQFDGRVLVGGQFNSQFAVLRFISLPSGGFALDSDFDADGIAIEPLGTNNNPSLATSVAIQGNTILAGGWRQTVPSDPVRQRDGVIVRYHIVDGTHDATFGGNGVRLINFEEPGTTSFGHSTIESLALQANGRILVAGDQAYVAGPILPDYDFGVARLHSVDITVFNGPDGLVIGGSEDDDEIDVLVSPQVVRVTLGDGSVFEFATADLQEPSIQIDGFGGDDTISVFMSADASLDGFSLIVNGGEGDDDLTARVLSLPGSGSSTVPRIHGELHGGGGMDESVFISETGAGSLTVTKQERQRSVGINEPDCLIWDLIDEDTGQIDMQVMGSDADEVIKVTTDERGVGRRGFSLDVDAGGGDDTVDISMRAGESLRTASLIVNGGDGDDDLTTHVDTLPDSRREARIHGELHGGAGRNTSTFSSETRFGSFNLEIEELEPSGLDGDEHELEYDIVVDFGPLLHRDDLTIKARGSDADEVIKVTTDERGVGRRGLSLDVDAGGGDDTIITDATANTDSDDGRWNLDFRGGRGSNRVETSITSPRAIAGTLRVEVSEAASVLNIQDDDGTFRFTTEEPPGTTGLYPHIVTLDGLGYDFWSVGEDAQVSVTGSLEGLTTATVGPGRLEVDHSGAGTIDVDATLAVGDAQITLDAVEVSGSIALEVELRAQGGTSGKAVFKEMTITKQIDTVATGFDDFSRTITGMTLADDAVYRETISRGRRNLPLLIIAEDMEGGTNSRFESTITAENDATDNSRGGIVYSLDYSETNRVASPGETTKIVISGFQDVAASIKRPDAAVEFVGHATNDDATRFELDWNRTQPRQSAARTNSVAMDELILAAEGFLEAELNVETGAGDDTVIANISMDSFAGQPTKLTQNVSLGRGNDIAEINIGSRRRFNPRAADEVIVAFVSGDQGDDDIRFMARNVALLDSSIALHGNGGNDDLSLSFAGGSSTDSDFDLSGGGGDDSLEYSIEIEDVIVTSFSMAGSHGLLRGGAGADTISLAVENAAIEDSDFSLLGGAGADSLSLHLEDSTSAASAYRVNGGADDDYVTAICHGVTVLAWAPINGNQVPTTDFFLSGGADNDVVLFDADQVDVQADAILDARIRGGDGDDILVMRHTGRVDGTLVIDAAGGAGNDILAGLIQINRRSRGTYDVQLKGNSGNDTGILAVRDQRRRVTGNDIFKLNGGRDRDRLFGTPQVEVLNGELPIDRPFEELNDLLALLDSV